MATSFLKSHKEVWKGVKSFRKRVKDAGGDWKTIPIQQSDYLKNFFEYIRKKDLRNAYKKYNNKAPSPRPSKSTNLGDEDDRVDVIIVGAGMAGLSAAYELNRVKLRVKILEQTKRYGGRVFSYGIEKGLDAGLYAEDGALRLPGRVDSPDDNRSHYLTDGYIKQFNLPTKMFSNYDPNRKTNIYGLSTKTTDLAKNYFDKVWPNWKDGMSEDNKLEINDIDEYYDRTTAVVTDQLRKWLHKIKNDDIDQEMKAWGRWIDIWSQFTLESFLESNINVIKAKVSGRDQEDLDMDALANLLPWSNDALRGYSVISYTEQFDQSLVQYLRDQLGQWWSRDMHCLKGGMESLPRAFFGGCGLTDEDIEYKKTVSTIRYKVAKKPIDDLVEVVCYPPNKGEKLLTTYKARAVIVTTPLNKLRKIKFKPLVDDEESKLALRKNLQATEDIFTGPSTKIFLQTKTRFWDKEEINGGFSKTNLSIGQLHYVKPDADEDMNTKKGLLLIYTWKNEALLFGSMKEEQVKQKVIEEVAKIHPEFNENEVEKCIVHAWYNKPSYQGAYDLLKAAQFSNIRHLCKPMNNVHFAGETISFACGWIQGALESGLMAAYQVYERRMECSAPKTNEKQF